MTDAKPLSARSVVLSLLLGAHRMSPAELTSAGEHFGIPPATTRVALTRAVAAGDLVRDGSDYVLGPRHIERQRHQDEAVEDAERAWDGTWELAIVTTVGRPGPERAALREELSRARLAELREGVWMRPANLTRSPAYAENPALTCLVATPSGDPAVLAQQLWVLDAWSRDGRSLLGDLAEPAHPAARLAVAAHLVRHVATDPLLPASLLPADWPGAELRAAYSSYQEGIRTLISH